MLGTILFFLHTICTTNAAHENNNS